MVLREDNIMYLYVYTSTYLIVTILTIQGVTKIKYVILIRVSVDTYTTRGIRAILFHI